MRDTVSSKFDSTTFVQAYPNTAEITISCCLEGGAGLELSFCRKASAIRSESRASTVVWGSKNGHGFGEGGQCSSRGTIIRFSLSSEHSAYRCTISTKAIQNRRSQGLYTIKVKMSDTIKWVGLEYLNLTLSCQRTWIQQLHNSLQTCARLH